MDIYAGGAARAGLLKKVTVVGVLLRVVAILLESGAKLPRT